MGDTNKVPVTLHWDSLCVACMKMLLHWTWLVSPFWEASLFPLYKWGKWGTMEQYKDAKTEASTDQVRHLMVGKPSGSHLFFIFSPLLWTWLYLWDRTPDQLWYQGLFASLSLPEAKDSAGRHGVFFFIFMWLWFTNILFFAYAKCSFQSSLGPITPPNAGSEKAPESTDGWLGNSSSAISQRRMPDHSAGEQRLLRGWDTGILCYSFCTTKGDYQYARFCANPGHCSY